MPVKDLTGYTIMSDTSPMHSADLGLFLYMLIKSPNLATEPAHNAQKMGLSFSMSCIATTAKTCKVLVY